MRLLPGQMGRAHCRECGRPIWLVQTATETRTFDPDPRTGRPSDVPHYYSCPQAPVNRGRGAE